MTDVGWPQASRAGPVRRSGSDLRAWYGPARPRQPGPHAPQPRTAGLRRSSAACTRAIRSAHEQYRVGTGVPTAIEVRTAAHPGASRRISLIGGDGEPKRLQIDGEAVPAHRTALYTDVRDGFDDPIRPPVEPTRQGSRDALGTSVSVVGLRRRCRQWSARCPGQYGRGCAGPRPRPPHSPCCLHLPRGGRSTARSARPRTGSSPPARSITIRKGLGDHSLDVLLEPG